MTTATRTQRRPVGVPGSVAVLDSAAVPGSVGVPGSPPVPRVAQGLLADAGRSLGRAIRAEQPADRFAAAHLAALRGAAAVLAARARPARAGRGSAWELLPKVAPQLAEWSAFFAAGSAKRQAAQAGMPVRISAREADDMVRQAAAFLDLVDATLGTADR